MTDREQALYEAACDVLELFTLDDPMLAEDSAFVEALLRLKSAVERYGVISKG